MSNISNKIDEILLKLIDHVYQGTEYHHNKKERPDFTTDFDEAKQQILTLLEESNQEARVDELKLVSVGKVTNPKQKVNKTYMGGFGYARNNLQNYKSNRIEELSK